MKLRQKQLARFLPAKLSGCDAGMKKANGWLTQSRDFIKVDIDKEGAMGFC